MLEADVQAFWNANPCGEGLVGAGEAGADYQDFFRRYDDYRYRTEGHILRCLDGVDFRGKQTLEVGLGQGADSEQIIRRGALWSGLDLTQESVARVRLRLRARALPYVDLRQGSILACPFADRSFDIVYSHGVLHHVPDIARAQAEIWRVLKPNGLLVIMVYSRWSLNYLVSIALLRRLGLLALYGARLSGTSVYARHVAHARAMGIGHYLRMENFIHRNTDGPDNPYSKVYDRARLRKDFDRFELVRCYRRFMHAPPLPVARLPLGRLIGWHLWAHLRPVRG